MAENVAVHLLECNMTGCTERFSPTRRWSRYCCSKHQLEHKRIVNEEVRRKMTSKGMHFARLENSPRLQRILKVLRENKVITTRELIRKAHVAGADGVRELRKNGFIIDCNFVRTTKNGSKIYEYAYRGKSEG